MNILIFGGGGYVGTALVPYLLERGHKITVVDAFWFGSQNCLPKHENLSVICDNAFNLRFDWFDNQDIIIFLAGLSNDPMAEFDEELNYKYNTELPVFIALNAKKRGVSKFIFASTCSIYGNTGGAFVNESFPPNCQYAYGKSKLEAEKQLFNLADDSFRVIALRKGTICGVSRRMRFDLIINTMYKTCLLNGAINVNNKSIWRPILDIRDAIKAYDLALNYEGESDIFNIASTNYTVGQIAEIVADVFKNKSGKTISIIEQSISDKRNYAADISKAANKLNFISAGNCQTIVRDLMRSFPDDQVTREFMELEKCYNIEVFKKLYFTLKQN